jgi:hypothetical protein
MYLIKNVFSSLTAKLKGSPKVVREIIYGLMLHEMDLEMGSSRKSVGKRMGMAGTEWLQIKEKGLSGG